MRVQGPTLPSRLCKAFTGPGPGCLCAGWACSQVTTLNHLAIANGYPKKYFVSIFTVETPIK